MNSTFYEFIKCVTTNFPNMLETQHFILNIYHILLLYSILIFIPINC
jgi:hypothetical protein